MLLLCISVVLVCGGLWLPDWAHRRMRGGGHQCGLRGASGRGNPAVFVKPSLIGPAYICGEGFQCGLLRAFNCRAIKKSGKGFSKCER